MKISFIYLLVIKLLLIRNNKYIYLVLIVEGVDIWINRFFVGTPAKISHNILWVTP